MKRGVAVDVVLLQDVERLGAEGAVVKVKPGFARNYLIPRGLAAQATAQQLKAVDAAKRQRARQSERAQANAEALRRRLEGHSLTLKLSLGAEDKPFGAITSHDIAEALRQDGVALDRHAVRLEQPIKTLGIFEVPVRVQADVTATVKVWVVKA